MIAGGFFKGAVGCDETLEKRVAGEAIRAMQASAGDLANGVKPADGSFAVHIGVHSAALVVGGGHDRDGRF